MVNMVSGELFTVDPETGHAALVDLGGILLHGDGMVNRTHLAKFAGYRESRMYDANGY